MVLWSDNSSADFASCVGSNHAVNVIQTTHEVNVGHEVKKIKFLLEEDLDKDDYLERLSW